MADHDTASILTLVQPNRPKTQAERARAYRERKKAKAEFAAPARPARPVTKLELPAAPVTVPQVNHSFVAPRPVTSPVTPSRRSEASVASVAITVAAFGLAGVGVTMNGWFARSLGSTDIAGWLFLAIGVAADLVALAIPSLAARSWQARQRLSAVVSWAVWAATFAFAISAGIGFASVNISDVTLSRASRVTPAVTAAQVALNDATVARDRECKGGVGKWCREREAEVVTRRQGLDAAIASVGQTADPQTEAAIHVVAWASRGVLQPTGDDFATLRLILLALLPQLGGVLLMIGRR